MRSMCMNITLLTSHGHSCTCHWLVLFRLTLKQVFVDVHLPEVCSSLIRTQLTVLHHCEPKHWFDLHMATSTCT